MNYANTIKFANELNKTLVFFDLEHTGGRAETRGITDIGAVVVSPTGSVARYSTYVNPGEGAVFHPFVTKLTGITSETVKDAPLWPEVHELLVMEYSDALWLGFNSKTCDVVMLRKECARYSLPLPGEHVDLMTVLNSGVKGSLSERVALLAPAFEQPKAHRGLADAELLVAYFELCVGDLSTRIKKGSVHVGTLAEPVVQSKTATAKSRSYPVSDNPDAPFLNVGLRRGAPWTKQENDWLAAGYRADFPVATLAEAVGRSQFAVAIRLKLEGLMTEEVAQTYKQK